MEHHQISRVQRRVREPNALVLTRGVHCQQRLGVIVAPVQIRCAHRRNPAQVPAGTLVPVRHQRSEAREVVACRVEVGSIAPDAVGRIDGARAGLVATAVLVRVRGMIATILFFEAGQGKVWLLGTRHLGGLHGPGLRRARRAHRPGFGLQRARAHGPPRALPAGAAVARAEAPHKDANELLGFRRVAAARLDSTVEVDHKAGRPGRSDRSELEGRRRIEAAHTARELEGNARRSCSCLLYTSDAADDM
eukprot:5324480-Prymnesium_polylepis.1